MQSLIEKCRDLAEGSTGQVKSAWAQLITNGGLWVGCQQVLKEPNGFETLRPCYEYLIRESVQAAASLLCPEDGEYLCLAARRIIAAAAVAWLVRHANRCEMPGRDLSFWVYRAVTLTEPPSYLAPLDLTFVSQKEADLISLSFDIEAVAAFGDDRAAARATALMVSDHLRYRRQIDNVPILLDNGDIARLRIALLDGGSGKLLRSPQMLRSFGAQWKGALEEVGQRVVFCLAEERVDALWEITLANTVPLDGPAPKATLLVDGPSAQAAFQVVLKQLADGELYDVDCVISATVDAKGNLGSVGGIVEANGEAGAKLRNQTKIKRVIVSKSDFDRLLQAARNELERGGLLVLEAETIEQARDYVSHTATAVRQYLYQAESAPDRNASLPSYMGGKSLCQLYVYPDLLKRERRAVLMEPGQTVADPQSGNPGDILAPEALDITFPHLEEPVGTGFEWRRVAWKAEWTQIGRAMLTAPPGQGKSLLMMMAQRDLAHEALKAREGVQGELQIDGRRSGLEEISLPIELKLEHLVQAHNALVQAHGSEPREVALRNAIEKVLIDRQNRSPAAARYLADHAHEARCWLLLDALDEVVNPEGLKDLLSPLNEPDGWKCHVLMTSRPYAYKEHQFAFIEAEYRLAEFNAVQVSEFIGKWFAEESVKDRLRNLTENASAVRLMSQNPYLLTLLCWIVERQPVPISSPGIDPLACLTRTQLYYRVIQNLLGLNSRTNCVEEDRAKQWMETLGPIALKCFNRDAARQALSGTELRYKLASGPRPLDSDGYPPPSDRYKADYLIEELQRKRFLVRVTEGGNAFAYPHRSMIEFLAGWELARQANEGGWQSIADQINHKAWLVEWEEVIKFLAGRLDDPTRLLELLMDASQDDYFRHRLALAALCLPEITLLGEGASARSEQIRGLCNQITAETYALWENHESQRTKAAEYCEKYEKQGKGAIVPHLTKALPALVAIKGRVEGELLLAYLCRQTQGPVGSAAVEVMDQLVEKVDTETVLKALLPLFKDEDLHARNAAVRVVGQLGKKAATQTVLKALVPLLQDKDWNMLSAVIPALGQMGEKAATEIVIKALGRIVQERPGWMMFSSVIWALGQMGEKAATETVVEALLVMLREEELRNKDFHIWNAVVKTLGQIGNEEVTETVLDALIPLLQDKNEKMRFAAVKTLGQMGEKAATETVVEALVARLGDENLYVCNAAIQTLGQIGNNVATETILNRLAPLLMDENLRMRIAAVQTMGQMGKKTATEMVLEALVLLLQDKDWSMRSAAFEALGQIGEKAATEMVLEALVLLLQDKDRNMRSAAVKALGQIGEKAATEIVIKALGRIVQEIPNWLVPDMNTLLLRLENENLYMLSAVIPALGQMGEKAATEIVIKALGRIVQDAPLCLIRSATSNALGQILEKRHRQLRCAAIWALGQMGEKATTETILKALLRLLLHDDSNLRFAAITTLIQGYETQWRAFVKSGIWSCERVTKLAEI